MFGINVLDRQEEFDRALERRLNQGPPYVPSSEHDPDFQRDPGWSIDDNVNRRTLLLNHASTVPKLKEFASKHGIALGHNLAKEVIITRILAAPQFVAHMDAIRQLRQNMHDMTQHNIETNPEMKTRQYIQDNPTSYGSFMAQPTAKIVEGLNAFERLGYGPYRYTAWIRWKPTPSHRNSYLASAVPVHSFHPKKPTQAEVIRSLAFWWRHGHAEGSDDVKFSDIDKHTVVILAVKFSSPIDVTTEMDWRSRAHFGGVLSYPTWTRSAANPEQLPSLEAATAKRSCGFDIVAQDLGLDAAAVEALVGKKPADGLTGPDMVALYSSQQASLYCFTTTEQCMFYTTMDRVTHEEGRANRRVFVLLMHDAHFSRPSPEMCEVLMRKSPDKIYAAEEEVMADADVEEKKERVFDVREAGQLSEALVIAESALVDRGGTPASIKKMYEGRIAALKVEKKAYVEEHKETNKRKGKNARELGAPFKAKIDALKEECKQAIAASKNSERPPVFIYVKVDPAPAGELDSFSRGYADLVSTQRIAYASNIDQQQQVTMIKYAPGVTIYANPNFVGLRTTAQQLGLEYINQTVQALARQAFKQFVTKGGRVWDHSVVNNAIAELLLACPSGGLVWSRYADVHPTERVLGVDFYRQYASIARMGGFYTLDLMAEIAPYDGHAIGAVAALYYVETGRCMALRGNGLYDYQVVRAALDEGLIKVTDIKAQIMAKASPGMDKTAREFVDHVYATVSDDKHRKQLVNMWVGSMGARYEASKRGSVSVITDNVEEAVWHYHNTGKAHRHIDQLCPIAGTDKHAYLTTGYDSLMKRATDALVRNAIVDRGRMAVWRLAQAVKKLEGARVLAIKTDCVIYGLKLGCAAYVVPPAPYSFGSLRDEPTTRELAWEPHAPIPKAEELLEPTRDWSNPEEVSPTEFFDAGCLMKYPRAFIEGFAGSGKTYAANELAKLKRAQGKLVKMCAFTHAAASLLIGETAGGLTAHSTCGIGKLGRACERKIKALMTETDCLIIDEVSMIPEVVYRILSQLPDEIEIYAFGDFRQFPPIEASGPGVGYKDSTMFKSLLGYTRVGMRKYCRADEAAGLACVEFQRIAEVVGVRKARVELDGLPKEIAQDVVPEQLPMINICKTNAKRREVNERVMAQLALPLCPMETRVLIGESHEEKAYCWEEFDARKLGHIIANPAVYAPLLTNIQSQATPED